MNNVTKKSDAKYAILYKHTYIAQVCRLCETNCEKLLEMKFFGDRRLVKWRLVTKNMIYNVPAKDVHQPPTKFNVASYVNNSTCKIPPVQFTHQPPPKYISFNPQLAPIPVTTSYATYGASRNNTSGYRGCLHTAAVRSVCPMRKTMRRIYRIPATSLNEERQKIVLLLR